MIEDMEPGYIPPSRSTAPKSGGRNKRTASEKLDRLRDRIQEVGKLAADLNVLAADYCLDELVESNVSSNAAPFYRSASNPKHWQNIDKGSFVYFVLCPQVNAVKIGFTNNLKSRLSSLQTGNPYRLKVLAWMQGGRSEEGEVHRAFSQYHTGTGEWFYFEGDLIDYILEVARNQPDHVDPGFWMSNCGTKAPAFNALTAYQSETLLTAESSLSDGAALPGMVNRKALNSSK